MQRTVYDRSSYKITSREYTDEGFLKVPGRVARTGIQQYLAKELGLGGNPNRVINVYRPPEEVFDDESLQSYDIADITNDHPTGLVDVSNFKSVSVGVVRGSGRRDGDFVVCDLIVKDKSTIEAIQSGKCELSAGYTAVYDECPGVTPDGESYEFVQRSIKINHVAVVSRARGGHMARVFDKEGVKMKHITLDSGSSVEISDDATAVLVGDSFKRLNDRAEAAERKLEQVQAVADARGEELVAAKLLTSDAVIAERVKAVATVKAVAARVGGEGFTCDSVDTLTIQRAALTKSRPTIDWSTKSEAYVQAAFDMAAEKEEEGEETKDAGGRGKTKSKDSGDLLKQLTQLAHDAAAVQTNDGKTQTVDHYTAYKTKQANAWKGE